MSDFFRPDAADLADDTRHLLMELDQDPGLAALNGECRPALDILETTAAYEVVVDVPGIAVESLRVGVRRNTVIIVGAKLPGSNLPGARFHLAERAYGRFVRAVRVIGAIDPRRATAVLTHGQLRIVLPRVPERRGEVIKIPVARG